MVEILVNQPSPGTLGATMTNAQSVLTLTTGHGAGKGFPLTGTYRVAVYNPVTGGNYEVMTVLSRAGDVLTLGARGQDQTSGVTHQVGDRVEIAVTKTALQNALGRFDLRFYGATADGVADDREALVAAEAALGAGGGTLLLAFGTYRVGSSLSLAPTTNLLFEGGATLAPAVGAVVTIGGAVIAGLYPIFAVGGGTVRFDRVQDIYPEWWGALSDVKTKAAGGGMTSGSATLATGGDPAFAPSDVGKRAAVLGAGAGGATLLTTVAAYVSTSQVTLAVAAGTTVASARWAIGSDHTANVQACLDASAAGAVVCPVVLSSLYGITSVRLKALQHLRGRGPVDLCGFYRLLSDANPAMSLAVGASGDGMQLEGFTVNAMFVGALDGIEIGTASAILALATGAFVRDVSVRNAGGWAFNLRVNGLHVYNCSSRHDLAPPTANTTCGAFRFIDSLVWATLIGCTGYYPAGAYWLGAGGGSIYDGVEAEIAGSYPTADVVTIAASHARLRSVYITGAGGTYRDAIVIPTGFQNHHIDGVFVGGGWTQDNLLRDVDRGYIYPGGAPLADATAIAAYRNRTRWQTAQVATLQTTTSTSYTDLATAGPAVALTPGQPAEQAIEVSADMANSGAGICLIAPSIAGVTAQDVDSATAQGTDQRTGSRRTFVATQANGATHTLKYRVTSGTGSFSNRRISAEVISSL